MEAGISCKLADFGLAKIVSGSGVTSSTNDDDRWASMTSEIGTPAFMSPELLQGEHIDAASCDVYAFGILWWTILSGSSRPYPDETNYFAMILAIADGMRPEIDIRWPEVLQNALASCWAQDPESRPSFQQLSKQADTERLSQL